MTLTPTPVQTGDDARRVIVALCKLFYEKGWVSGTGGGISIRLDDRVYMAPSGIQKEMIQPEWIYELDLDGEVLRGPPKELGFNVSQCRPLFLAAMKLRGAGAVVHSHSRTVVQAAALAEKHGRSHIGLTRLEMLKGLKGVAFDDLHEVPVIANTALECDLTDSLTEAIEKNPGVHAVVVQRHGVYIWGDDWLAAKRHAECYDELFAQAVFFDDIGVPLSSAPHEEEDARNPGRATQSGVVHCSFCEKSQREVKKIIAGPSVYICDECIALCNNIIADEAVGDDDEGATVDET